MDRPPYEILEHTADVGLKVYGETLPELFANAGRGLVMLALESPEASPKECRTLSASGGDREELLVHWLSEVLYAMDAEGWLFCDFRIGKLEADSIEAEGWGERRERGERRRVAVKAVTYHQVSVRKINGGWEAVVYFDI